MLNTHGADHQDQAAHDAAAKITEIRDLLSTGGALEPQDQLRRIAAVIERDQPASHEIYQKPWG